VDSHCLRWPADQITAGLPGTAWQRICAGAGGKGHRHDDWALITLPPAQDAVRRIADVIALSIYRRRHQDQAKTSHYARQALTEP